MRNEVKLQESHPVDENLRPIKVGGDVSSLEISKTGNGARVTGDLEVTGDITGNIKDTVLELDSIISTDLTVDDSGDITIDADGGDVFLKDDGDAWATLSSGLGVADPSLKIYESIGGADYVTLGCSSNGHAKITSVDAAGNDAHITLKADGDITLDSYTGKFIAKKAGNEFSVANSSFAGMILGYTTVGIDATADSYSVTTSFVVTDSAHKVKFIAPPSGAVEISVTVYGDLNRRAVQFGLSDNAVYNTVDVTHEHSVELAGASTDAIIHNTWVIIGLTAGTAYEYWLGAKSSHTLSSVLRWGGDATGEYPPFIMKATALPIAVTDFAVYG